MRGLTNSGFWLSRSCSLPGLVGRACFVQSLLALTAAVPWTMAADKTVLEFQPVPHARYHWEGLVGDRTRATVDNWLLPAPLANPGMLEMFRDRDRQPTPNLVPWAGEFVGKYLISAIQILRMTERPDLRATVARTVAELIATQAEDGYLGPFPLATRLKGNWDLWGHYHCLLALMMWHEASGDPAALLAGRRAADLICSTFLDSNLRVFDSGSPEMNMAVIHGLAKLYRLTAEPRYLRMIREIEKDWERAGDYLRTGLDGIEFFQSPRPRWESLHDLQGLLELYLIDGKRDYRTAFAHHWRSIARWDRRNTGGFSSGEQATGNPYAPTAIETCCTVAWMALTIDMLQLSGDSRVADELELSFFNAALGAQHPSCRWFTYNTPMNGAREASAHSIVFQARAGTPELNCCSVNGPRGLGSLADWAVMAKEDALVVNYYGPGTFQGNLADRTPVALEWTTDYPFSNKIQLRIEPVVARHFKLLLRIPAWSQDTTVELNGQNVPRVIPGQYLELARRWAPGDRVSLRLDLRLRAIAGDRETTGRVSIYRGPLLLAYDQHQNAFDEQAIPKLDLMLLAQAKETVTPLADARDPLSPRLVVEVPAEQHQVVRLCDFASAGARGTRYDSWLAASRPLPPPVVGRTPADGAHIPPGPALFRWTGAKHPNDHLAAYELTISARPDFSSPPILQLKNLNRNWVIVEKDALQQLSHDHPYYWSIRSINSNGSSDCVGPLPSFTIDTTLVPEPFEASAHPDDLRVAASLLGRPEPETGQMLGQTKVISATGMQDLSGKAIETDGDGAIVRYSVHPFPDEDYSVSLWANFRKLPESHLGQICSAWAGPLDDPLRVCIEKGKLFARLESGQGYSTAGLPIQTDRWYHIAAVKTGSSLRLFLDGALRAQTTVPLFVRTKAQVIALGGNPNYAGNEFLSARFANLVFYGRELSLAEIQKSAQNPVP